MIPLSLPAAGDEGLVAEVHRAGLNARDIRLCLQAAVRSIVMSLAPPVDTIVVSASGRAIRSDHVLNSSGRPLGSVVLAHVQVHDRGPGGLARCSESAISSVAYGMLGLFSRNTSAPVTATGEDHLVAVPSACMDPSERVREARSSSVIGQGLAAIPEYQAEPRVDHNLPGDRGSARSW
jgi:hypothetical protein